MGKLNKNLALAFLAFSLIFGLFGPVTTLAAITNATVEMPTISTPSASNFGQQIKTVAINLTKGNKNSNVTTLQQFLISQNKGKAAQNLARAGATSYFGVLTRAALAEFQAKVGIIPAWGNFGPITRAYLMKTVITPITYYLLDPPAGSSNFCDGENMDSDGYKSALTEKITRTVLGNLTTEEKIKTTLRLAADAGSFDEVYTRVANTTFEDGVVTMHSADGWAGSSIFYCAWKPFVEKNLEQFSEVAEIRWETDNN